MLESITLIMIYLIAVAVVGLVTTYFLGDDE